MRLSGLPMQTDGADGLEAGRRPPKRFGGMSVYPAPAFFHPSRSPLFERPAMSRRSGNFHKAVGWSAEATK